LSSLTTSLQNQATTQLNVSIGGLSLGVSAGNLSLITGLVSSTLATLVQVLDPVINGATAALGVQVGYMDVTATGMRCGTPALVN
jgi:uncharacterized membrane protein